MTLKIEKIKKLRSGKYKLELENNNKFITYDTVILNNQLLFKKELSNEFIDKLDIETKYYDIYQKCVKYISIKMRSKKEIINYLEKQQVNKEEQDKIVKELIMNGLINDQEYLKAFISDKVHLSNIGPNKIKKELLEHEIDSSLIDLELQKYEKEIWLEKLEKIIQKKWNSNHNSVAIFKQKTIQELLNLGYEKEDIILEFDNFTFNDSSQFEKTADKVFNQLSKKYNGYELKTKLKAKLYQKGYSIEKINHYIEKRID